MSVGCFDQFDVYLEFASWLNWQPSCPESGASLQRGEGSLLRSRGQPYLVANARGAASGVFLFMVGLLRETKTSDRETARRNSKVATGDILCCAGS
jgi:hypothetical protein